MWNTWLYRKWVQPQSTEVEVNKEKQRRALIVDIIMYQGKSFENDSESFQNRQMVPYISFPKRATISTSDSLKVQEVADRGHQQSLVQFCWSYISKPIKQKPTVVAARNQFFCSFILNMLLAKMSVMNYTAARFFTAF